MIYRFDKCTDDFLNTIKKKTMINFLAMTKNSFVRATKIKTRKIVIDVLPIV